MPVCVFCVNQSKITEHTVSMPYPSAFFALMTHKSVTCAIFPNKPGVPLTEKKSSTRVHFFGDGIFQLSFFSHTSILRASSVLYVSPAQVSSFTPKFSLGARFQNLFLQPHPLPLSISPALPRASPYRHLKPPPPQPQLQPHLRSARIQSGNPPISITSPA